MGLNFFNPGARRGVWSTSGPGRFTPAKDPVPILQVAGRDPETVWKGTGKLASTGIGSMDRPVRSDSLYRLRYPDFSLCPIDHKISQFNSLYLQTT